MVVFLLPIIASFGILSGLTTERPGVLSLNRSGARPWARPFYSRNLLHIFTDALSIPYVPSVTRMMLARLTPSRHGFELQYFDCPKCDYELTMEIPEVDPLKKAEGWLSREHAGEQIK